MNVIFAKKPTKKLKFGSFARHNLVTHQARKCFKENRISKNFNVKQYLDISFKYFLVKKAKQIKHTLAIFK